MTTFSSFLFLWLIPLHLEDRRVFVYLKNYVVSIDTQQSTSMSCNLSILMSIRKSKFSDEPEIAALTLFFISQLLCAIR